MNELAIGELIYNKYIIEKVLGVGGFGITYYAKHTTLQTHCAIKELFITGVCVRGAQTKNVHVQGISDDEYSYFKEQFVKEAGTLAKLDHENVVKIIDMFEENNTSYIVMPFVEGVTLQQLIKENGKLDYETAVNYILQIAEAIGYIHERNFLHRDISPDNIIITPQNKTILIDFGSAREFIHDKTQTVILRTGYAPLEQYTVTASKGTFSDIYSLGAVFYFILTGQKPMEATNRIMSDNMPEPKSFDSSIPEEANRTILKAMALMPENRLQNIEEFTNELSNKKTDTSVAKDSPEQDPPMRENIGSVNIDNNSPKSEKENGNKGSNDNDNKNDNKNKGSSKRNTLIAVGIVIVVVIICGGGIFLMLNSQNKPKQPAQTTTTTAVEKSEVKDKIFDIDGNKFTYSGEVKNGYPNGKGSAKYEQDERDDTKRKGEYTGNFVDGRRSGDGIMIYYDKNNQEDGKYEGRFSNDMRHGRGKITYRSKSYLIGEWKNGKIIENSEVEFYKSETGETIIGTYENGRIVPK